MTLHRTRFLTCALMMSALPASVFASPISTLWGVDEDQGQLFSLGDYTDPYNSFTDYGKLKYDKNGKLKSVGAHIEAFTIGAGGIAYMAINKDISGFDEPVLMSFDINAASTADPNVISFVGEIGANFNHSGDNITGLSFQPGTGLLYALFRDNGSSTTDRLLIIDPATGGLVTDLGQISGLGQRVGSGEDLVFDPLGNLYLTDNQDDHLYRVDPTTAAITAVIDADESGGLGHHSVKFEGLAWDFSSGRLVGTDDNHNLLAELTFGDGGNLSYGSTTPLGLTDIEGMAFVPEPATVAIFGLLAFRLMRRRGRRPSGRLAG